jgi:release factor glutamine methyltransferase
VIVDRAAAVLAEHGVETARTDAEWIVAHVAGVARSNLATDCCEVEEADVWPLVLRRANREPLAYVLGEWDFRRLTLRCDERALVPRPETESLVERSLEIYISIGTDGEKGRVLDVGTGTGAIALALADEAGADVVAMDASEDALELARENAARLGLQVRFVHGDLRDGLPPGPFDLVVSNPPYVRAEEYERLEPEVRDWEPREALVDDGQTEALVRAAMQVLRPGGVLLIEIHEERAREMTGVFESAGYEQVTIGRDLAGKERLVEGRRV